MSTIRVLVVDDHAIVRDGLAALLGALPGFEVVGTAASGREALVAVAESTPHVVLMDIQMPGDLDGIDVTRRVRSAHPGVRVLMLSMNEDDETVLSAMRAGACGYLLKGSGGEEVAQAVRLAHGGGMVFGSRLAGRVADLFSAPAARPGEAEHPFPDLSPREREVLDLLAAGLGNDAIAKRLYVSDKTVRNAVSGCYAKLGVASRAEAIVTAREAGLGRSEG